jgi:hypothetical protein
MPTNNPRINITFDETTAKFIAGLAKHENRSVSGLAKDLILEALDRREDMFLSDIAKKRDIPKAKRVKHSDVWK